MPVLVLAYGSGKREGFFVWSGDYYILTEVFFRAQKEELGANDQNITFHFLTT